MQQTWLLTAEGKVADEKTIPLPLSSNAKRVKRGRMDLFVDPDSDFITIVEIKGTNWDRIKPGNVKKLLGSHRRQVWKYINQYVEGEESTSVCAGMIYPTAPGTPGLKEIIEEYLNEWALQVVWFDDP